MDFLDFKRRNGLAGVKKSDTSGTRPARSDRSSNRPENRSPASDRLIHIVAMLIVLVALVSLANRGVGLLPGVDGKPLSLLRLLGWLMAPVAWMTGIP